MNFQAYTTSAQTIFASVDQQQITQFTAPIYNWTIASHFRKPRAVFVEPTVDTFGHLYDNYQPSHLNQQHVIPAISQYNQPNAYEYQQQQTVAASWAPPEPFTYSMQHVTHHQQNTGPANFVFEPSQQSPVQNQDQILEEIVRECEEIERRSTSSASPNSVFSSSDEAGSPDSFYHPYRTPEKKERKKAQNRQAATRYREKKRKEKEMKLDAISELTKKNDSLKSQVGELEREIHYIKKLMTEVGVAH